VRLAREQIGQRWKALRQERRVGLQIQPAAFQRRQTAQRHDHRRRARRRLPHRRRRVDVLRIDAQRRRHRLARAGRAERDFRRTEPQRLAGFARFEAHRHLPQLQVQPHRSARIRFHETADRPRRAHQRMPRERQLARRREEPHAVAAIGFRHRVHEGRFRVIRLRRDQLHGFGGEVIGVGDDCQLVAGVGAVGEDVEDVERMGHEG